MLKFRRDNSMNVQLEKLLPFIFPKKTSRFHFEQKNVLLCPSLKKEISILRNIKSFGIN